MTASQPLVIAHRGACGYLPEHTLAGYAMACAMGADYIEPDLVATRDGVLICCHDIHFDRTTDVAARFPDRARADGRWYAADFSFAEIKTLAACERVDERGERVFPGRFAAGARGFQVPAFAELLELVASLNRQTGRRVGVYPETKEPAFHAAQGLALEPELLRLLAAYGYAGRDAAVFIQSFAPDNLRAMRHEMSCDLPMIQLLADRGADFAAIAGYADGVGPDKALIAEAGAPWVAAAHDHGLLVHPYTFRADQLGPGHTDLAGEIAAYVEDYGVDGLFTDFCDVAVNWRVGRRRGQGC